jgi:chromosome partitioning protein
LAVEAEKAGAGPVALIDTDPQGSLAHWWNARVETTPAFAQVAASELKNALRNLEESGIRLVIIDTPPSVTEVISQVISCSDLVITPTRPSPHDLRSVGATVDIAQRHNKPLIFVVNGATARSRINGEMAMALSQHGTVTPVTIHNRVDFAASMVDGRTVGEVVPNSPAAKEVADLWAYVQDRLARLSIDSATPARSQPSHFSVAALSRLAGASGRAAPPPPASVEKSGSSPAADARPAAGDPLASLGGAASLANDTKPAAADPSPEPVSTEETARRLFGGSERRVGIFGRR